ncbi:DUF4439 domain-containing protein [Microlunatus elymi]|uniref:DUF4439 domain-containing protein n=1 Tax=Microlunatus elymi TaxID=2596828 RepID=A0A516PYN4_9ACTN|nr:DUF4439 domain-containing protein [Microlunatus elymi]QDP96280.1 DUF4439 domain-containing protein [Microlunatus elymi]
MTEPAGTRNTAGFTGPAIGRRSLLIMIVAGGLALAGCTGSGPLPTPSSSAPPSPTPTPLPGTVEAAATEDALAGYAHAMLTRYDDLEAAGKRLITRIRDAHVAHAAVLNSTDPTAVPAPTSGASTPTSSATAPTGSATPPGEGGSAAQPGGCSCSSQPTTPLPTSSTKALKTLRAMETKAAAAHRKRALAPTGPQDQLPWLTLLWGSLSSAAASYAQALAEGLDPGEAPLQDHRVAVELPSATGAVQSLVEQCYAVIFGYQAALAKLSGSTADHARSSLAGYRDLRDQLSGWLTGQDTDVPAAHAAYRLPIQPTNSSRAAALIGTMEDQLLPFLGQWLATTEHDQQRALDTMITGSRNVGYWSDKINLWPGWPVRR